MLITRLLQEEAIDRAEVIIELNAAGDVRRDTAESKEEVFDDVRHARYMVRVFGRVDLDYEPMKDRMEGREEQVVRSGIPISWRSGKTRRGQRKWHRERGGMGESQQDGTQEI